MRNVLISEARFTLPTKNCNGRTVTLFLADCAMTSSARMGKGFSMSTPTSSMQKKMADVPTVTGMVSQLRESHRAKGRNMKKRIRKREVRRV